MYPFIILVGSKNGANSGSDASPPMQSFTEESSPENMTGSTPPLGMNIGNGRALRNCQSTESLDSLSDESGGHSHNKSSSSSSRKVIVEVSFDVRNSPLFHLKLIKVNLNLYLQSPIYFPFYRSKREDVAHYTIAKQITRMS